MIRVVNKRCGAKGEYIGRPSPLGNPYVIGRDGDRAEVIALYRSRLWAKIQAKDPAVMHELARLHNLAQQGDLDLQCWCAPLLCHGDVIKACLEWLAQQ